MSLTLENLSITAGDFRLEALSCKVPEGEHCVLTGRTGTGKTLLLETICGLRDTSQGRLIACGQDITDRPPAERGIGYVPQDGAIFKSMRIDRQIGFPLAVRKMPSGDIQERVAEVAGLLGITHLLKRTPIGLSGGERQRTALARAIAARPKLLLLDEPMSALDDDTRHGLIDTLRDIRSATGATVLHVSHNMHEAKSLGTCFLRIENGRMLEITP
ncbi:MAG: ATP-binding cassette domain-containing protein [Phycisphaerales bacterium]|nr:ATP-binding cassette domain-containing protein [Phycisphaerales bacterium]